MIQFDPSFARDMSGFFVTAPLNLAPDPKVVFWNDELGEALGLNAYRDDAETLVGNRTMNNQPTIAFAYAGHQFGGFSPRLGDGRAFLLAEVVDKNGERKDIHLKGSGLTSFSRPGSDGKAVLGPVLREYLMGEAMNALGIPTTRALAVVTTGEDVWRDELKPGAVLVRIAASHIRVGSFQYFAARGEAENVRKLADYAVARHYPELTDSKDKYLSFLNSVVNAQAKLIAKWMSVGFVHGVMNTDNMAISGETIDYGPCAFMDAYSPDAVFSSIDRQGRYAYGRQPIMAQWNLARLAEALLPLLAEDADQALFQAEAAMERFSEIYLSEWRRLMNNKIGLTNEDNRLLNNLLSIMNAQEADFTRVFRSIRDRTLFTKEFSEKSTISHWYDEWENAVNSNLLDEMDSLNPIYIPRNHKVEEALFDAEAGVFEPFARLLEVVRNPYVEHPDWVEYAEPAPVEFGAYKTFCGT